MNIRLQRRILLQRRLGGAERLLRGRQRVACLRRDLRVELLEQRVGVLQGAVQVRADLIERLTVRKEEIKAMALVS